ncbi:hypothetical protein ABZ896_17520 [Streptomyces sp. NPDC047072]|uniref:hypothetical protein n=1 Tax=Streptomyces sp. NPDC047072 TaxID=3154809 RepID=UPI0033D4CFC4
MRGHESPSPSRLTRRAPSLLLRGLLAVAGLTALVVGIPWGLIRYIGWPLPGRFPTWSSVEAVLLAPMSTSFLLNTLACILWPVWSAFVYDVVRVIAEEARVLVRPVVPRAGPLNSAAAVLVGAVIMTLLARPNDPATAVPASVLTSTATTAKATTPMPDTLVAAAQPAAARAQDHRRTTATVVVELPHDGIYDSLWRIADRTLGDGNRWPEIYALNRGHPQPDGRSLDTPDLIRPGWILRLPYESSNPRPGEPGGGERTSPTPESPRPPDTSAPAAPSPSPSPETAPPSTPAAPSTPTAPSASAPGRDPHGPGVSLPTGAFVGIGLAALVTAALLTVRWRRRVSYLPGSGERDDLTIAPVVRALRVAHDDADLPDDSEQPCPGLGDSARPHSESPAPSTSPPTGERLIGVKNGQALAWNIARSRGLGFVGPGALDAIRALLITLFAEPQPLTAGAVEILIPASDVRTLIGEHADLPAQLRVVDDLDAALDVMEAELLTRTRTGPEAGSAGTTPSARDLVLVATPAPHAYRRLQAVLDNGSTFGLAGILFGQWRPGGTVRIRPDGTVAASSASCADLLTGARLFTLPIVDARALLDLLRDSEAPNSRRSQRTSAAPEVSLPESDQDDEPSPPGPTSTRHRPRLANGRVTPSKAEQPNDDAQRPLRLAVLGRTCLTHHPTGSDEYADLSNSLAPKQREVLVHLALHRVGARREVLTTAIWPDAPRDRPYNSFHATLSQLRRALRTATNDALSDVTLHEDGHYRLDRSQVTVDLWHLQEALENSREASDEQLRRTALERVVRLYAGDLATDLTAEWIEAPREALRRDVLDTVSALVRILRDAEPEEALALLERARTLDPYNEAIYRDIARFQAYLGQHDSISRTFSLLTRKLAEIDHEPSRETIALRDSLQRPRSAKHASGGRGVG